MKLVLNPTELQPIVEAVVNEALDRIRGEERILDPGRIAFSEPEASQLMGLPPSVLRDARLRGELAGSRCGRRVIYEREELIRYLRACREER